MQNKLFQKASLLMCYCSFAIGQFLTLKNHLKNRLLNCCLKFTLQVTQVRAVFYVHTPFCELYSAFNGISHKKLFAIFFQTDGNFYQIILSHTQGRSSNKLLIKNFKCPLR